jgi:hypothetical protein
LNGVGSWYLLRDILSNSSLVKWRSPVFAVSGNTLASSGWAEKVMNLAWFVHRRVVPKLPNAICRKFSTSRQPLHSLGVQPAKELGGGGIVQ